MINRFLRWMTVVASVLLVLGIVRAANSHYAERRTALYQSFADDQKRLGLTDRKQLFGQYPTPEVTLCQAIRIAPGATGEVVIKGKFAPGSHFLFENDDVEVVKENATATEYRATVRTASSVGPSYSPVHIFTPVSGGNAACIALSIGGKFEWNFTAQNGWRIKVHPKGDSSQGSDLKTSVYTAEFYRGTEAKPFEVLDLSLGLGGALYGNSYSGALTEAQATQAGQPGDPQAIMQKLMDPNTSDQERQKLVQQMTQMNQQMVQQSQAAYQNMAAQQQREAEFGCQNLSFSAAADAVTGQVSCGQKVGRLSITGTRRFVGP